MRPRDPHSAPVHDSRFGEQLLDLCSELERWRADEKQAGRNSKNGFPRFERKAGAQSLVFFVAMEIVSYFGHWVQAAHSAVASIGLAVVILISLPACPILFLFQAIGFAKPQFWRALASAIRTPRQNYPFTPLANGLRYDCAHSTRLQRFRTETLTIMLKRIKEEDVELRERLTVFIGAPTPLVLFGIVGGIFSAWENYHSHPQSIGSSALFYGSIASLLLSVYAFRLRDALFELTRCQTLLSLEVARRTEFKPRRQIGAAADLSERTSA